MLFLISLGGVVKFIINLLFVGACLLVCALVLMRQSESGGLSTAFGGPGDTFLGARAAKTIDKVIIGAAVTYIVLAIFLNLPQIQGLD